MPELPDIAVYGEALTREIAGAVLQRVRILNPFLLRTAVPPIAAAEGRRVAGIERLGKRVVLVLDAAAGGEPWFLVIHLMIAGRLRWLAAHAKPPGKIALEAMDPGGIDVLSCDLAAFTQRLASENHTLKRALTNPRLFSGIGNAYGDEILHRARLSPVTLTRALDAEATRRLFEAARAALVEWTERLRGEAAAHGGWPDKVTAFHPAMAVHGRYGQPCPVCGSPVQRIVHADNETNYCARCQTGGKLLADRALSRLLKASWPKHIDDID